MNSTACIPCDAWQIADGPARHRCHAHGVCGTDGECTCNDGFSGTFCETYNPCDILVEHAHECSIPHPARICNTTQENCVTASLPSPAWVDDDPTTPEQPAGQPVTPAQEYLTQASPCMMGLPAVIHRTERWLQLAEDYMLQTATGNAAVIASQLCTERRFQTLGCLASNETVGNRTLPRTQARIIYQLDRLSRLHDSACTLHDTLAHSIRLRQSRDVPPRTFEAYHVQFDNAVSY
eukprot:COSAG02_NODE_15473_length_1168_cov_1.108513_1_plen_235_part_10